MGLEWKYKDGKITTKAPPESLYGFVYELTLQDGKKYIGQKKFWSRRKRHFSKKEIEAMPNKRLKKWEYTIKESDWRKYTSSSKLFGSREVVEKKILELAHSKRHLTYLEYKYQFQNEVLENDEFVNDNIAGKFYTGNLI